MQTSSNFFNKNLLNIQEESNKTKHQHVNRFHIVSDPLRSKDELTPWSQINPRYNLNTERLIKFKQKINQQSKMQIIDQQDKHVKSQMISNLFNFYKNNKQKKRSTLNMAKRRSKNQIIQSNQQSLQNGWSLPSIKDRIYMQEQLLDDQAKKKLQQQQNKQLKNKSKKRKQNYIQSISISQYLNKLKQKQKVIALSSIIQKNNQSKTLDHGDQFTSNRYVRKKSSNAIHNSLNFNKSESLSNRYISAKNPQLTSNKKKNTNKSALQSLEHSFQLYKKAAQKQVHQKDDQSKISDKLKNKFSILDKNLFKSNVPLSSLFFSADLDSPKQHLHKFGQKNISPKKFNTISYDRSSTNITPNQGHSLILPKVTKNHSFNK